MACNSKASKGPPRPKLCDYPLTKEKQREALLEHGYFILKSKTFDPNSVRDFFITKFQYKILYKSNQLIFVFVKNTAKPRTIKEI
jgi:hypothetical protein